MAQIEKWEESCNCQYFKSLLQQSHFTSTVFPFSASNAGDPGLSFRPLWFESTQVLQGIMCVFFFFFRDLELLAFSDSSMQSRTKMQYHKWHEAQINISIAALKANSDNFGFYVQGSSDIKEPLIKWNNDFGSFSLLCVIICAKISAWLHALSCLPNISSSFQPHWSFTSQTVRDSKSEINVERKSFTLCIDKQSQQEGHLIFQI